MNADRLAYIGETLFPGGNWKNQLAEVLDVHSQTIRRWIRNDAVKPGYEIALELLLKAKVKANDQ